MDMFISDKHLHHISSLPESLKSDAVEKKAWRRTGHRESFLLHMRPRVYRAEAVAFTATYYLGFFSVFFLLLECITGLVLMVYYIPTPDQAYGSILRLTSEVPFGWLMRDLHRLGGECMIIVVVLHMVRVFGAGAYRGKARFTWVTGIVLMLCTLMLAFSGYLLPWDQLAFWAVTIGTGITEVIPGVGTLITVLIRGGSVIGQDGLLRFYLLHILVLPLVMILFTSIHYYRVVRLHNTPVNVGNDHERSAEKRPENGRTVKLYPSVTLLELFLSFALLSAMIAFVVFIYDAPLGNHADPNHTPVNTRAPWFFLWLQGLLKIGDSFLVGICLPVVLFGLLCAVPYLDHSKQRKTLKERPFSAAILVLSTLVFMIMSFFGLPSHGTGKNPVNEILQHINPEEQASLFHHLGYDNIGPGVYVTYSKNAGRAVGPFRSFLETFADNVNQLTQDPDVSEARGIVLVEEWQENLKKITVRIQWSKEYSDDPDRSAETIIYLFRSISGDTPSPPRVRQQ